MEAAAVVVDSGGCSVRLGLAGGAEPAAVFPNCTGKGKEDRQWMIGDMLLEARHISGLSIRRPVDRGFVVSWDTQQEIWSRGLTKVLGIEPRERALLLTEPPLNLEACRAATEEVVFEGLGFQALHLCTAAEMVLEHAAATLPASAGLVLDCGFSFTHAVPIFDGRVVEAGVRRLNLGGKAITNLLKEMVSYRSLNMMDETYLMEIVKDTVAFVSQDLSADLLVAKQKRSRLHVEYVLPDGVHNLRGYARDPFSAPPRSRQADTALEQTLMLGNERFMPIEALFRPTDIGMHQAGLAELLTQAADGCPPQIAPLLLENVVVTGGTARCPGFKNRLRSELRPLVDIDHEVEVHLPERPDLGAWLGGSRFASSPRFRKVAVTRAEYEEHGRAAVRRLAEA